MKALIALALVAATGCVNYASGNAKDGNYELSTLRSTNPEALARTLSMNRSRELRAEAQAEAIKSGRMSPYGVGHGVYRRHYCPGGQCLEIGGTAAKPAASQTAPAAEAPAQAEPQAQATDATAAEALAKANAAIEILEAMRPQETK